MQPSEVKADLEQSTEDLSKQPQLFAVRPGKDFTRDRKLPLPVLINMLLTQGGNTNHQELSNFYMAKTDLPPVTDSAFCEARAKLKPEALNVLSRNFAAKLLDGCHRDSSDMLLFAVDGSDIYFGLNENDKASLIETEGAKSFNQHHLNALYNVNYHIYMSASIQPVSEKNEIAAMIEMVKDCPFRQNALFTADRGYESYNLIAHFIDLGAFFLIRAKRGGTGILRGLKLPLTGEYDITVNLSLTRKNSKETRRLCAEHPESYKILSPETTYDFLPEHSDRNAPASYDEIAFRVVMFRLEGSEDGYEALITNLPADKYPPEKLKEYYHMRWEIETSFRNLKHGLNLVRFHSVKPEFVCQEIYAKMIMHNFCAAITKPMSTPKEAKKGKNGGPAKYDYRVSFTDAIPRCREYYLGTINEGMLMEKIKMKQIPVRPGRHYTRDHTRNKPACCPNYRAA